MRSAPRTAESVAKRVTVTKVNLSERASARYQEQIEQMRAGKPHDIRNSIPMVDYTNPAKFPPYMFREYPKMPLLADNQPIYIDDNGAVLIFHDAADEVDFKDLNPDLAEEIDANSPGLTVSAQIAKQDETISNLRKMLLQAGVDPDADKPNKEPSSLNRLAGAVRTQPKLVEADDEAPDEEDGASETPDVDQGETDDAPPATLKAQQPPKKAGGLPNSLKPGSKKAK